MELTLNLAWMLLAAAMVCLWLRFAPSKGASRRMQLIGLAVLLLLLFPVISVTDDLQALQNPAETDCCQRRSHICSGAHPLLAPVRALPAQMVLALDFGVVQLPVAEVSPVRFADRMVFAQIQNRPPPAA